jgi:hypothetical protein
LKTLKISKLLFLFFTFPGALFAQEQWGFNSSFLASTGNYIDSQILDNQRSLGVRVSAEKNQLWGITAGIQTNLTNTAPITQTSHQTQDNLLISAYAYSPSQAGRWTLQLDAHKLNNTDTTSNTRRVQVLAPKVTWQSYSQPLRASASYAKSNYLNIDTINQFSPTISYGFNNAKDWLEVRRYFIKGLTPSEAYGKTGTNATDIQLTHLFHPTTTLYSPTSVTLGLERGNRIYAVDMVSQVVYNLPMLNYGGESLSATWLIENKSSLTLQLSTTRYHSETFTAHNFKLNTLSTQFMKNW